ncbi:MAG TPA: carbohydrate ABC transporter, N-acetylglucosamine/diacetylchitobiose-binding protein, partial [Kribbella sp.]
MTTPNNLSRRLFLQRAAVGTMLTAGGSTLLAACASGGSDDSGSASDGGGTKSDENPFGVKEDAALDVVIFKGGYGDDYAKAHEALYTKKFPKAQVKHAGITDITPQLQPRFNGGNPPDVIDNSGASLLPMSTLAGSGQLADLT